MNKGIFKNLFVLDMANNHQGDLKHASNIINAHSKIVNEEKINGCIKFQYRNLKTFIHPNEKRKKSNKHTSRFLSTKMSEDNLKKMADLVKINGLLTMTTPFDKESLELIEKFNIDIVKIASCSATDWPLLKTASKLDKPLTSTSVNFSGKNYPEYFKDIEIEILNQVDYAVNLKRDKKLQKPSKIVKIVNDEFITLRR